MILAVLQARMSSHRLPGKVLLPIGGQPMMLRQIERLRRSKSIDKLVVATSIESEDDAIFNACDVAGVICRRGPLEDVLQRFVEAAKADVPDHLVRLTADCPLADWSVIDELVALHLRESNDYTSNTIERSFPHGLDCEIMKWSALQKAADQAASAYDREHVTPYLYNLLSKFIVGQLVGGTDLSFLRWTVDHAEDFQLVDAIYTALYAQKPAFETSDVIDLLGSRLDLRNINTMHLSSVDACKSERYWASCDEKKVRHAM